ncbi:hypothetical protein ATG_11580 [Desulfurococcaceae archaeon AG1]|nr:hypothetical protein ATG_11580 [Desulfurococcaceae archaeon AG1]
MLELRSVSKRFGGIVALDNISLKIDRELVGIIGPNGSGKTTLFNTITGHVKPDRGSILFMGSDIARASIEDRVRMGILRTFQQPKIFWSLSVEENIEGVTRDRSVVEYALKRTGLWEKRQRNPRTLTLGEIRRLEIARCLALKPKLLLLDEPFAGLISSAAAELGELINDIYRELGIGVIIIEHKISHLSRLAKRIVAMNAGKIVFDAPVEEAMGMVRKLLLGGGYGEGASRG